MKVLPLPKEDLFKRVCFDLLDSAGADDELIANYFVVRGDEAGIKFCEKLYLAACRGARVTLIIDSYGSLMPPAEGTEYHSPPLSKSIIFSLVKVGVRVLIYHPIENPNMFDWKNIRNWKNFSRRNHNKNLVFKLRRRNIRGLVIGDGQWSNEHFNGHMKGSNLYIECDRIYLENYCYQNKLIHSEHVEEIRLSYAKAAENVFKYLQFDLMPGPSFGWYKEENFFYPSAMTFVASAINFEHSFLRHTIQDHEIELLDAAKKQVNYCTPYFSPDLELQDALIHTKQKLGEELKVLIGKFRNDPYLPYGVRKVAKRLLPFGVEIFEYAGLGNIHYKDMIADNYVFIKTANGEGRSRFYNLETGVVIHDSGLAQFMRNFVAEDILNSTKLHENSTFLCQHPWWHRLTKSFLCPLYYHHL